MYNKQPETTQFLNNATFVSVSVRQGSWLRQCGHYQPVMRRPGPIVTQQALFHRHPGRLPYQPGTPPVPGTSTDAEKVGLHGPRGEAGPQWHSTVCAKTAKWQSISPESTQTTVWLSPSVWFQVQVTSKQLYWYHLHLSLTRLWPQWGMWWSCYAKKTTMKAFGLEVVKTPERERERETDRSTNVYFHALFFLNRFLRKVYPDSWEGLKMHNCHRFLLMMNPIVLVN